MTTRRPTVLIVGSGYAGFHCSRALERRLTPDAADIVLASPQDYLLYTSLLPQVAAGVLEPRHLAVGLRNVLRRTRLEVGHVVDVDLQARQVTQLRADGSAATLTWDRLVLAPGAVTRTLGIPGIREHAHGLKSLAEAVALRDHVLRELEHADAAQSDDTRSTCCTFVVVGAGYTGTELAAQMQLLATTASARYPRLRNQALRWVLVDVADRVLPDLAPALSSHAISVLQQRGVEVRLRTSVKSADAHSVTLSDGSVIATHTVIWTAGVTPNPLIAAMNLPTVHGRLVVDAQLRVSGRSDVFALGDAAAVPDLTRQKGTLTGQTAQHAQRQGKTAARNVAASLGVGRARAYRHRDLGFVVDLGGVSAVANPLHLPISGLPAAAVTRGYHLLALPSIGKRIRVATDWFFDAALAPQLVQLGFVPSSDWSVHATEQVDRLPIEWHRSAGDVPRGTVELGTPPIDSFSEPTSR